jgi:glycosyltransferase involved in cell wall biosynthesis
MPLISFVIPFYNRTALLKRAVQSILFSGFNDIEIILVDDASSENNIDELSAYIRRKNITYLRQPENRGPGAARNRGLNAARGEWVFFMDSDDLIYPEILSKVARFLTDAHDCDIVILAKTVFKWPDGSVKTRRFSDGSREGVIDCFLRGHILNFSLYNFFYKKSFLIENSIYAPETYLNEDEIFAISAYCHAKKIDAFTGDCFYEHYFDNDMSLTKESYNYESDRIKASQIEYFSRLFLLSKSPMPPDRKKIIQRRMEEYLLCSQWEPCLYNDNEDVKRLLNGVCAMLASYSENWSRNLYISPCFLNAVNLAKLISAWGGRLLGFIDNNPASPRAASLKKVSGLAVYKIHDVISGGGGGILVCGKYTDAISAQYASLGLIEGKDYIKTGLL